ncbi:MAG: transcriptional regulator, NifA subfamily, Fis Family, partial [Deltaproteobacteria bacterium]|nr:transcriptional regulator, NifA subfamily, Fis Family [Deltaproteobacteria bacterium]
MTETDKLVLLSVIGRMHSERELAPLLNLLKQEIKDLIRADLVSVFGFDRDKCELRSFLTSDNQEIRFDARLGVAGAVAMNGASVNIDDAPNHPLFFTVVDSQTGYRTKTVLGVPMKNTKDEVIGVCEAINKQSGPFTQDDVEIMEAFAAHAANAIETALLIDALRKERDGSEPKGELQRKAESGQAHLRNIVGMSPQIQAIVRLIDQIRDSSVDVLIQGESGTGKELVASALHFNSPRYNQPFIALNCASLPDNLVEAELYGIEKGVATGVDRRTGKFEAANGGTLFLDEIGDLSLSAQAKMLRVLQERTVDRVGGQKPLPIDVRVIAATNKNLERAITERTFREELYYRLKVVRIQTPPLREIAKDIPLIAKHFLAKHCSRINLEPKQFTPAAAKLIQAYLWPGNARQLENEIKRLVASVRGPTIGAEHLDLPRESVEPDGQEKALSYDGKTIDEVVENIERRMLEDALKKYHWNKQKAAQELGLSR